MKLINAPLENDIKLVKWKVRVGSQLFAGNVILMYESLEIDTAKNSKELKRFKSSNCGIVNKLFYKEGEVVKKG